MGEDAVFDEAPTARARKFPRVPLIFLGLGFYRAWIEIVYVGSFSTFPIQSTSVRDVFDLSAVAVWVIAALLARRIVWLGGKRSVFFVAAGLLVLATAANFYSLVDPAAMEPLSVPVAVGAGIGIALLILVWSEFYGCLNPVRVALYYSASMILGAAVIYLYKGLVPEYLAGMTVLLPILSAFCAYRSFRELPEEALPAQVNLTYSFPWKPVLLMAVYSFAYGLNESTSYEFAGPHSSLGVIVAAGVVLFGVLYQGRKFNFGVIYRFGLPCMVAALLLVPALGFPGERISGFFSTMSYTAFSILIMIVLSTMVYRYGMSALWLFGIERGVRQLFMLAGRECESLIGGTVQLPIESTLFVNVLVVLLVVAATMILLTEKDLTSTWGSVLVNAASEGEPSSPESPRHELGEICAGVSREYGLSVREAEVLLLLAQKKSIGLIERELYIANGTAKAHVRHIYQKLDIHSRDELFELIDARR